MDKWDVHFNELFLLTVVMNSYPITMQHGTLALLLAIMIIKI